MFYRIRIDLAFTDYDPLNDLIEEAMRRIADAVTINPGTHFEEKGYMIVEQCFHDEHPSKDCQVLAAHYTNP